MTQTAANNNYKSQEAPYFSPAPTKQATSVTIHEITAPTLAPPPRRPPPPLPPRLKGKPVPQVSHSSQQTDVSAARSLNPLRSDCQAPQSTVPYRKPFNAIRTPDPPRTTPIRERPNPIRVVESLEGLGVSNGPELVRPPIFIGVVGVTGSGEKQFYTSRDRLR